MNYDKVKLIENSFEYNLLYMLFQEISQESRRVF